MKGKGKRIGFLILWLALLAMTIAELATGIEPEELVANFLALASPLIVYLTSRR